MNDDKILEIQSSMVRMEHALQRLGDKQDEILADVRDVKTAIYNPDNGLYARLRELEQWKAGVSKFIWGFGLSIAGLIADKIFNLI